MLIALVCSLFTSICVYHLLARDEAARLDRIERGELTPVSLPEPALAATVTFFLGLAAPYFLARSRGPKGLAQGIGLLLLSWVGYVVCSIGLALLLR